MSIKSTTILTREECIRRICEEIAEFQKNNQNFDGIGNDELELKLEDLREANGHIFDNYIIEDGK